MGTVTAGELAGPPFRSPSDLRLGWFLVREAHVPKEVCAGAASAGPMAPHGLWRAAGLTADSSWLASLARWNDNGFVTGSPLLAKDARSGAPIAWLRFRRQWAANGG